MTHLLLGPVLRHVDTESATVWVETDGPCTVEVAGAGLHAQEPTFCVAGHYYALVCIDGLEAGHSYAYEVRLGGDLVWPPAGSRRPPSRIRTIDPDRPFNLVFGSCRFATAQAVGDDQHYDLDALDAFAIRMAGMPPDTWPDAMLMVGDQVYADDTTERTRAFIAARRDISRPPGTEVADFEEYTQLYYESWTEPDVRWLMSTLPSSMIFDDHDVRDDWNTSHAWRVDMQKTSWWEERITGGLMSYWIYQHLGNLAPVTLADDDLYQRVRAADDAEPLLREFAQAADREADGGKGARWSYRRDFGRIRLLVIDSRCGRVLEGTRSMVSEPEFTWIEEQVQGEVDHLLIGTSLPWLMPRALHDLESWNEVLCDGARGQALARFGEVMRRASDLEHWAAFRESFDRLGRLLASVGRGEHGGEPPATVCVLSGDVHHAYAARARFPDPVQSRVYQLTCSPLHNYVPVPMHWAFRFAWSRTAERTVRWLLSPLSKVPPLSMSWERLSGPYFGNEIATLTLHGRSARLLLEKAGADADRKALLTPVAAITLSSSSRDSQSPKRPAAPVPAP